MSRRSAVELHVPTSLHGDALARAIVREGVAVLDALEAAAETAAADVRFAVDVQGEETPLWGTVALLETALRAAAAYLRAGPERAALDAERGEALPDGITKSTFDREA